MTTLELGNAVDELIPALIQCFGVIVLGYLAGRWSLLSESQVLGLNAYVTKFALPAVFFKVMVTIDFSGVCWYLVAAVSVSKLLAFVLAFVFTMLLSRSSQLGLAAILAMFVSQSNDVALGYPVLKALYPDLASYIYLFAPAQLIILNPFAYFSLEWHRAKQLEREANSGHLGAIDHDKTGQTSPMLSPSKSRWRRMLQVLWRVLLNPLFFMTLIGVIFNFILKHHIPDCVDGLFKIIAESFAATALFTLGFGMVGKMSHITQHELYILAAILLSKLVILPFVTRELVVQMLPSHQVNETLRYSTFGFLYGAIPTAPPVYLFAAEYQVIPAVIGVGQVLGTFLCAPMMFILARMVTMYLAEPSDYDHLLGSTVTDVSWVSIVGCIWTFIVLFLCRKAFRIPHRFVVCHLICVMLSCAGVVAGTFLNRLEEQKFALDPNLSQDRLRTMPADWVHYVQFSIFFVGCTGARCWTTLLALSLFLQRFRSVCFVLRHQCWFYLCGFATPVLVTSLLLITSSRVRIKDVDPAFQYGTNQLIVSLVVLVVNTVATLVFLVWYIRLGSSPHEPGEPQAGNTAHQRPQFSRKTSLRGDRPTDRPTSSGAQPHDSTSAADGEHSSPDGSVLASTQPDSRRGSQQSLILNRSPYCNCTSPNQRRRCTRLLVRYDRLCTHPFGTQSPPGLSSLASRLGRVSESGDEVPLDQCLSGEDHEFQHQRHMVFILVLLITMLFGIFLCTWRLVQEPVSGVYLVLEFLDGAFNFGQGIVLFVIFGLDADLIILPIRRFLGRHLRRLFGVVLEATSLGTLVKPINTANMEQRCRQFVACHLTSCSESIVKPISALHPDLKLFTEDALKRWLEFAGLVQSDTEAVLFVDRLESEGLIVEAHDASASVALQASPGCPAPRLLQFTPLAFEIRAAELEMLDF